MGAIVAAAPITASRFGVLVGTALPGTLRVTKVNIDVGREARFGSKRWSSIARSDNGICIHW